MSPRRERTGVRLPNLPAARWVWGVPLLLAVLMAINVVPSSGALPVAGGSHAEAAPAAPFWHGPAARTVPSELAAPKAASPHRALTAFNPPCYPIPDPGNIACVSIENPGESQIIPTGGNHTASVEPAPNESLPLIVKSHVPLNHTTFTDKTTGPNANIAINVSGTLWNGDMYYSKYEDNVWHANPGSPYWQQVPGNPQNNKTYPWWYLVNISARGPSGPNFFAGEEVTWWIEITNSTNNNTYVHHYSTPLSYIYSGAWPYSPYPGAYRYAGTSATLLDVNLTQTPRAPNWNDSTTVTVNTTQADVSPYNASIGSATLDLVEVSHGLVIANTSFVFPVSVDTATGFGNTSTSVTIPAGLAQVEGAMVSYRVWIADAATPAHQLVTPWINYTVGGNGSFVNGIFASDLFLTLHPAAVLLTSQVANLTPGEPLSVQLQSQTSTTSILAAEIQYSVSYPILHETMQESTYLVRQSATDFTGSIPGLPMGSIVNFTVFAWDFGFAVDQSTEYTYVVQSFEQAVGPNLKPDLGFFYVYVYDNGTQTWVNGASVQIQGPSSVYNSLSNTTFGVAYANQTSKPEVPLLVASNTTYKVTVTDARFVPGGGGGSGYGPISVDVVVTNPMTVHQPLASTSNYLVIQNGDQILFYLNATAPGTVSSPSAATASATSDLTIAGIIGLLGAAVACVPLAMWFDRIKKRRTAEEKRVTL